MKTTVRLSVAGVVVAAVVATFLLRGANRPPANMAETVPTASAPTAAPAALPRLVDLGRGTCVPCKLMAPILENLSQEYAGKLIVEVIDLRDQPEAAEQYGIRVIPTQIFYDTSRAERFRHEGFMSKDAILAKWRQLGVELETRPGLEAGGDTEPGAAPPPGAHTETAEGGTR